MTATDPVWRTCTGHEPGCPCLACCYLNSLLNEPEGDE